MKSRQLLQPLSKIYAQGMTWRNAAYDRGLFKSESSNIPVVCIGNATVGGSGKSPFTMYLARQLLGFQRKPVILSRGYGGKRKGPYLVRYCDGPQDVGDEPLMHYLNLAPDVPVVVSRQRVAGAKFIEENNLGDVIILDDGFQHRALQRDLNVLLVDVSSRRACNLWKEGRVLPSGTFREKKAEALSRAHCVVFLHRGFANEEVHIDQSLCSGIPDSTPKFLFRLTPAKFVDAFSRERFQLDALKGRRCVAATAIAKPETFFRMLEGLGLEVSRAFSFRDHHQYSKAQWRRIEVKAQGSSFIVTTEKDVVKLGRFIQRPGKVYTLSLSGRFDSNRSQDEFFNLLNTRLVPLPADLLSCGS